MRRKSPTTPSGPGARARKRRSREFSELLGGGGDLLAQMAELPALGAETGGERGPYSGCPVALALLSQFLA